MYRALRPLLFRLPPERAHALTLVALRAAWRMGLLRGPSAQANPVRLAGLEFPNRVGLAAGFDKNGVAVEALAALGFGFIEIGTVTPQAQPGNPPPRILRVPQTRALINRMGFPNDGAETVARRLGARRPAVPCGVNIGKNAHTPLDRAVDDYVAAMRVLYGCADYLALNISSPNTADLRRLHESARLRPMIEAVLEERLELQNRTGRHVPVFVKLSPDLTDAETTDTADVLRALRVDGIIATNSTEARDGLGAAFEREPGGLSGEPLHARSVAMIARLRALLGAEFPLIGVGGIVSTATAQQTFDAGADLIQVYTGLVYEGPSLIRELLPLGPSSRGVAHDQPGHA